MNMFDEARAMSGTLELCKITQKELGARMGVSQSYIANKLRLLNRPKSTEELICAHDVSERHARSLLRLRSESDQLQILEKVISRNLTVRECEALVDLKVDEYAPFVIEKAQSLDRIDAFHATLKKSLDTLRSFGMSVKEQTNYHGDKMYITIILNDI